ncbi:MAG: SDR family oxidoreductase [Chitinophagaceae bacterium]|nr:SDR family oxidoreductase [Chitinophagaceae bacterium]MCB9045895.1 SDR family oxidoreductase [Chitinophagales bacterium]
MRRDVNTTGRKAIITGASGGIGRSFARQLAAQQYDLVLSGRNESELVKLADELRTSYGVDTDIVVTDLSHPTGIEVLTDKLSTIDSIDMLVSNAGYGERSRFEHEPVDKVLQMISVFINATVQLVHAVLPKMINAKKGSIITVSSLSAFVPAPGSSIYSSSKVFLNSFMESIYMEVRKYGIRVQSLCPGLTHTGFHNNTQVTQRTEVRGLSLWMEPDMVVEASLRGLDRGEVICVPGHINKVIKRIMPVLPRKPYYAFVNKIARRFK